MDQNLRPPEQGMPRWVKVFVVVGAVIAVLAVVSLVAGGEHGPGRHLRHGIGNVAPIR